MKSNVISILQTATIREAAVLFVTHHIGLLPIVDEQRRLKTSKRTRSTINFVKFPMKI
ncbi:MAG: CBS domain-containing protein [Bacteroidota bacterium]